METNEVKIQATKMAELINALRTKQDALEQKYGEGGAKNTAEMKALIDKVDAETKRLDAIEKKVAAPPMETKENKVDFGMKMRGFYFGKCGNQDDAPAEVKAAMSTLNDQRAGYLKVPAELEREILKKITEIDPVRGLSRVIQTSGEYQIPKRTAGATAAWVAEQGTRSADTTLAYGLEVLNVHEGYVLINTARWMLQDAAFNLEEQFRMEAAEAMAYLEGAAGISGNGIGKWEGMLSNTDVLASYIPQGEAATLTSGDALIKMYFGIKEPYATAGTWLMSRATMAQVSLLKGGDGQYLLRRLGDTPAWNILGQPVRNSPSMPAIGANTYPVLFGDYRRAYCIVDRIGSNLTIADPYTNKTTGVVDFLYSFRSGGSVVLPEAIIPLKIAVS